MEFREILCQHELDVCGLEIQEKRDQFRNLEKRFMDALQAARREALEEAAKYFSRWDTLPGEFVIEELRRMAREVKP